MTFHPLNASDFSSFLLQAQASKASVINLANGTSDTVNTIKAAYEFGITPKQTLVPNLLFINDVHALGLRYGQGMVLTTGFYWDRTEATRAWSRRFFEKMKKMPSMIHAGGYSAVTNYLKAVQATKSDDGATVARQLKKVPIEDFFAQNGKVREDGRMVHDNVPGANQEARGIQVSLGPLQGTQNHPGGRGLPPPAQEHLQAGESIMKTRAAVLTSTGASAPYAESRPMEIWEVDLAPPGPGEVLVVAEERTLEERTLKGSYMGSCIPRRDMGRYLSLHAAGKLPVDRLVTGHLTLDQINEGFDRLARGKAIRQIIRMEA